MKSKKTPLLTSPICAEAAKMGEGCEKRVPLRRSSENGGGVSNELQVFVGPAAGARLAVPLQIIHYSLPGARCMMCSRRWAMGAIRMLATTRKIMPEKSA